MVLTIATKNINRIMEGDALAISKDNVSVPKGSQMREKEVREQRQFETTQNIRKVSSSTVAEIQKLADELNKATETGRWARIPPIEALSKTFSEKLLYIVDGVIAGINITLEYVEKALKLAELLEAWAMKAVSAVIIGLITVLQLLIKLVKKIQSLLTLDILGESGAITWYTCKPNKYDLGPKRAADFVNLTRKVALEWDSHPTATNSTCAMLFIPIGALVPVGDLTGALDKLIGMYKDDFLKASKLFGTVASSQKKAAEKANSVMGALIQVNNVMRYDAVDAFFSVSPDTNLDDAERLATLITYKSAWWTKVRMAMTETLGAILLQQKAKLDLACQSAVLSARNAQNKQILGSGLKNIAVYMPSADSTPEIILQSNNNNYFFITSINVYISDPLSADAPEPINVYFNRTFNVIRCYRDQGEKLVNLLISNAEYASQRAYDFANPPAGYSYFDALSPFTNDTNSANFDAMTPEEKICTVINDHLADTTDSALGDIMQITADTLNCKPEDVTYKRYSLSNRRPLTGRSIKLEYYSDTASAKAANADLKAKIWEAIDPAAEKRKEVYVTVSYVDGSAISLPQDFTANPTAYEPPVGWMLGDAKALAKEQVAATSVQLAAPATSSDRWYSFSTPSYGTEMLLREVLPKQFQKKYKQAMREIDYIVEYLKKKLEELEKLDETFKEIMARIREYIATLKKLMAEFREFIRAILQTKIPVMYLHIWKGDASRMADIIPNAVAAEGLLEGMYGGVIVFGESSFVSRVLALTQTQTEIEADAAAAKDELESLAGAVAADSVASAKAAANILVPPKTETPGLLKTDDGGTEMKTKVKILSADGSVIEEKEAMDVSYALLTQVNFIPNSVVLQREAVSLDATNKKFYTE